MHAVRLRIVWILILLAFGAFSSQAVAAPKVRVKDSYEAFGLKRLFSADGKEGYVFTQDILEKRDGNSKPFLLLSFNASWCQPCRKETDALIAWDEKYGRKGLSIVLVNIDKETKGIEKAKAIFTAKRPKFPVLSDRFNLVSKRYFEGEANLPASFLIDPEGSVVQVFSGADEQSLCRMENGIREALKLEPNPCGDKTPKEVEAPPIVAPPKKTSITAKISKTKKKIAWIPIGSKKGVNKSMLCRFKTTKGMEGKCSILAIIGKRTRLKASKPLKKGDSVILTER